MSSWPAGLGSGLKPNSHISSTLCDIIKPLSLVETHFMKRRCSNLKHRKELRDAKDVVEKLPALRGRSVSVIGPSVLSNPDY